MNLGTTRTLIWTIPPLEGAKEVEEYRFTFGSCNMAGSGRYWACLRDFNAWYEEQFGKKHDDAIASKDTSERAEAFRYQNLSNDYGAVIASLRKVESRTRSLDDAVSAGEWQEAPIPAEWSSFAGFYDDVSWAAVMPLADAAHAVNPGLWRFQNNDEAKKNGGANAG